MGGALFFGLTSCQENGKTEPNRDLANPDKVVSVSYCSDEITSTVGMNSNTTFGAAAQMPVSMLKEKGTHIVGIRVGIMEEATDCRVFVSKELGGEAIEAKAFTAVVGTWTYITLQNPIYIEGDEDYFIGYTMTSSGYCIGVESKNATSAVDYVNASGSWSTMKSLNLGGRVSVQAMVAGGDYDDVFDVSITNLSGNQFAKINSTQNFSCVVTNEGNNAFTGFTINYVYGETADEVTINNKLMPGETYNYTLPSFTTPAEVGDVTVSVVVSINHEETSKSNNSLTMTQTIFDESYPRMLMIEQFTGQGCGYCPNGTSSMKSVLSSRMNEVVWAAHHYGFTEDALSVAKSESYLNFGVSGAPSMMIDRTKVEGVESTIAAFHPAYITDAIVNQMLEVPSFVQLNLDRTFNELTKELKLVVSGDFLQNITNARMNVFIVQDSIIAYQADYVGTTSNNYVHNHAVRAILSDTWGDTFEVAEDGTFSVEYTYTLPDTIASIVTNTQYPNYINKKFATVPEHMEVQVFITNHNSSTSDRKVQNAAKIALKED